MQTESKYGYKLGDIVTSKVELSTSEIHPLIYPAGTKLKIVAIAPKVTKAKFYAQEYPKYYDNKDYFYNAVIVGQENDYEHRVRADFITIKK